MVYSALMATISNCKCHVKKLVKFTPSWYYLKSLGIREKSADKGLLCQFKNSFFSVTVVLKVRKTLGDELHVIK